MHPRQFIPMVFTKCRIALFLFRFIAGFCCYTWLKIVKIKTYLITYQLWPTWHYPHIRIVHRKSWSFSTNYSHFWLITLTDFSYIVSWFHIQILLWGDLVPLETMGRFGELLLASRQNWYVLKRLWLDYFHWLGKYWLIMHYLTEI